MLKWWQTTTIENSSWENMELAPRTRIESFSLSSALLTEFCTFNSLIIGGNLFQHKIHKTTWTSPDGSTENQIDHVTIRRKWRGLLDVRVKRRADAATDYHLVVVDLKVKPRLYRDRADRPSHKYNMHNLKDKIKAKVYQCELRNRFSALARQPDEISRGDMAWPEGHLEGHMQQGPGEETRQHKEWLTAYTWTLINERKQLKNDVNQTQDLQQKRDLQAQYWELNRQVKKSTRADKRSFIHDLTEEAETAAGKGDTKRLYEIKRTLSGKNKVPSRPVKDKNSL